MIIMLSTLICFTSNAMPAPEAGNPKAEALYRELDAEGFKKSHKTAVAAYIASLQTAIIGGVSKEWLQIVKIGQDCIHEKFGSRATLFLRRAEAAMTDVSRAKSVGSQAEGVIVDDTDVMLGFYRAQCKTM